MSVTTCSSWFAINFRCTIKGESASPFKCDGEGEGIGCRQGRAWSVCEEGTISGVDGGCDSATLLSIDGDDVDSTSYTGRCSCQTLRNSYGQLWMCTDRMRGSSMCACMMCNSLEVDVIVQWGGARDRKGRERKGGEGKGTDWNITEQCRETKEGNESGREGIGRNVTVYSLGPAWPPKRAQGVVTAAVLLSE